MIQGLSRSASVSLASETLALQQWVSGLTPQTTSLEIATEDEGMVIRGRIDVLVLNDRLWLLVIESKRSDFAVTRAVPQALAYMLGNPQAIHPTFGMITNGNEFLFLKAIRQPTAQYANSRLFSLVNPDNELYPVLQILKRLGQQVVGEREQ